MAEVVGVIGSVIAIAGLAKPTAKFVKALRNIAADGDPIASEIDRIATHVVMSSGTIDVAVEQLRGHCKTISGMQEKTSGVLQYIAQNKSTNILITCSKAIIKQMNEMTKDLNSMKRRPNLLTYLKWYIWKKMEVESLFPELDRVIGCLSLMCPILHLEINQHLSEGNGDEVRQCMKAEM